MTLKRIRALVIWCTASLAVLSVVYAPRENMQWQQESQASPALHLSKSPSIDFRPDGPETKPEKEVVSPSPAISAAGHWQRSQLSPRERPRDFIWIIPEDFDADATALGFKAVPDWKRIAGELLLIGLIGGGLIFALQEKSG